MKHWHHVIILGSMNVSNTNLHWSISFFSAIDSKSFVQPNSKMTLQSKNKTKAELILRVRKNLMYSIIYHSNKTFHVTVTNDPEFMHLDSCISYTEATSLTFEMNESFMWHINLICLTLVTNYFKILSHENIRELQPKQECLHINI